MTERRLDRGSGSQPPREELATSALYGATEFGSDNCKSRLALESTSVANRRYLRTDRHCGHRGL
jgi:hypothetical protein